MKTADLVTFTEENLSGKLHFLRCIALGKKFSLALFKLPYADRVFVTFLYALYCLCDLIGSCRQYGFFIFVTVSAADIVITSI